MAPETSGELKLTVNGEMRRIAAGATIADLVESLGLTPQKVAVEHNAEIAPRSTLADVALADGDVLEIVHFVGGG
jgi:thiamine biosynthesis protein ThiS